MIIAPIHIATQGMLAPISDTYTEHGGVIVIDKPILMATQGFILESAKFVCPHLWIVPVEWIAEWDPDP